MGQISGTGYFYPSGVEKPTLGYKFAQILSGNLPAGSPSLSGTAFWLTDTRCAVIYGQTGWVRILTGSI